MRLGRWMGLSMVSLALVWVAACGDDDDDGAAGAGGGFAGTGGSAGGDAAAGSAGADAAAGGGGAEAGAGGTSGGAGAAGDDGGAGSAGDAGMDAAAEAGEDAGMEASAEAGEDAGMDAAAEAGEDAGMDAAAEAGADAGMDGDAGQAQFWTAAYNPNCAPPNPTGYHNPGTNCLTCHSAGALQFAFGGTVFNAGGTEGVAHVEVGVKDGTGFHYSCTGTNGNFYLPGAATIDWLNSETRMRNANGEAPMMTPPTSGACNTCHGALKLIAP